MSKYRQEDLDKVTGALETMIGTLAPDTDIGPRITALLRSAMNFAETIEDMVPDGKERESALDTLAEVVRLCSKGITDGALRSEGGRS